MKRSFGKVYSRLVQGLRCVFILFAWTTFASKALVEIEREQNAFRDRVFSVLEATPDVIGPAKEFLESKKEDLTFRDLFLRIGSRETVISMDKDTQLSFMGDVREDHPLLIPLNDLLEDLQKAQRERIDRKVLEPLIEYYKTLKDNLLKPQCSYLLKPPILLRGEGIGSSFIEKAMAQRIILKDRHGKSLRKEGQSGTHTVSQVGGVYFKVNGQPALMPGFEIGIYGLHQILFGEGIIPTHLLEMKAVSLQTFDHEGLNEGKKKLMEEIKDHLREEGVEGDLNKVALEKLPEVIKENPSLREHMDAQEAYNRGYWGREKDFLRKYPRFSRFFKELSRDYVIQASKPAEGLLFDVFLEKVSKGEESLETIDLKRYGFLFLGSLLTDPGDSKGDNYIIEARGTIVGIDNDEVFKEIIRCTGSGKYYVGVKNVLWALPDLMEKPLHAKAREDFLSLSPALCLLDWITFLEKQNERYQSMELDDAVLDDILLPIQLEAGRLAMIYRRFIMLQEALRRENQSHNFLLSHIYNEALLKVYQNAGDGAKDYPGVFRKIYNDPIDLELLTDLEKEALDGLAAETLGPPQPLSSSLKELLQEINLDHEAPHAKEILERFIGLEETPREGFPYHASWKEEGLLGRMIEERADPRVIEFLIDLGHLVKVRNERNAALLHKVFRDKDPILDYGDLLLKKSPSLLENMNGERKTPLECVMEREDLLSFRWLVDRGAGRYLNRETTLKTTLKFYGTLIQKREGLGERERRDSLSGEAERKEGADDLESDEESDRHSKGHEEGEDLSGEEEEKAGLTDDPSHLIKEVLDRFAVLEKRTPQLRWMRALYHILPREGFIEEDLRYGKFISPAREAYFLRKEDHHKLFMEDGRIRSINTYGRHPVARIEREGFGLYFKFMPELPGIESAVGELTRKVIGWGAPYTDLFMYEGSILYEGQRYENSPVLVSLGIEGENFKDAMGRDEEGILSKLDSKSTMEMILMAFLTNPEDGKPDNYILEEFKTKDGKAKLRPVCVDNDRAFVPAIAKERIKGRDGKKCYIQVKTILYILPQMLEVIPKEVKETFRLNLRILEEWLAEMWVIHDGYKALFKGRTDLFKDHQVFIGVPFRPESMNHLYTKVMRLRQILNDERRTPLDVLKALEPALSERYERYLRAPMGLYEKFRRADGAFYGKEGETLSQSIQLLYVYGAKDREEVREQIRGGRSHSVAQALEELKKIAEKESRDLLGHIKDMTDIGIETYLESLDDGGALTKKGTQDLFQNLKGRDIRRFTLKGSPYLTTGLLKKLSLHSLTMINLQKSVLNLDIIDLLAEKCIHLQVLNLSGCEGIKSLVRPRLLSADKPIFFKALTRLDLRHMKSLEEIKIISPTLKWMDFEGNEKLESLKGDTPRLRECYHMEETAIPLDNFLESAGFLKDGMDEWQRYEIRKTIEDIHPETRPKTLKHADYFMKDTMTGFEKASIISAVYGIKEKEIEDILKNIPSFIGEKTKGQAIAAFIRSLQGVGERHYVMECAKILRDQIKSSSDLAEDTAFIIGALARLKEKDEIVTITNLIKPLITEKMDGGDIAALIEKLRDVRAERREEVIEQLTSFITKDMSRWLVAEIMDLILTPHEEEALLESQIESLIKERTNLIEVEMGGEEED